MRILVITQYFWPESFRINELVLDLHAKGHKVTVFTGMPNYPQGKYFEDYSMFRRYNENYKGISIKRVPIIPRGSGKKFVLSLNYFSFVLSTCIFLPFRLREKYDLIFVYEPSPITVCLPAILVKKIRKIPILFWVQDLWPESLSATGAINSKLLLKLVNRLVRFIYNSCDFILIQSKAFRDSIKNFGVNENKIKYFPNSAESIYVPIENNRDNNYKNILPNGFRVIFAGNIGVAQSMETIVRAAEILKEYSTIQWIIIGNGRRKAWLEDEIKKQNLESNMHLLGQKPLEEMPYYFAAGDILLATLKRNPIFSLTIPSKIQSYLACGKPIVASIDGETANVIKESGAGIAVEAENPKILAEAVLKLYSMQDKEREEMGKLGRKYFEKNFESTKLIAKLEEWMLEIS